MSNFTPLVKKEYEFDGDKITVTFARLNRKDMLNVLPTFKALADSEDDSVTHKELVNDVLNELAELIPDHVKTFDGLLDTDGGPIPISTVVSEMYFIKLSTLIAMDLIKESGAPTGEA